MRVLAGDIGGTKTILAVVEVEDGRVQVGYERRVPSRDYPHLGSLVREVLAEIAEPPRQACFGIAAPVVDGRAKLTNLPWALDAAELEKELGLDRIRLVNDFVATVYGIEALGPHDLEILNPGEPAPEAPIAVIGAGTGLGEAVAIPVAGRRLPVPGEGGHADFAPQSDREMEFLRWMRERYGHVSYERVLSGPGLANIYSFFRETGHGVESDELRRALSNEEDAAPVIHRFAEEKKDPLAEATLDLFVSVYGAEAGNLALTALTTGGVYVAGGIAPRMISRLKKGDFRRSFISKGRLSKLVEAIPVFVVMNPKVGLLGAAVAAAHP